MNRQVEVPNGWIESLGTDVKVGICDTFCHRKHPLIYDNIMEYRDFTGVSDKYAIDHGTHVSGVIVQAAPDCDIYYAEVANGKRGDDKWLRDALRWLQTAKIDVLNLSLAYPSETEEISKLLQEMSFDGVLISAARAQHPRNFPASHPFVISAGSYGGDGEGRIDLYGPWELESSVGPEGYGTMKGNSVACAYVSGICAMAKGFDREMTSERMISELMKLN